MPPWGCSFVHSKSKPNCLQQERNVQVQTSETSTSLMLASLAVLGVTIGHAPLQHKSSPGECTACTCLLYNGNSGLRFSLASCSLVGDCRWWCDVMMLATSLGHLIGSARPTGSGRFSDFRMLQVCWRVERIPLLPDLPKQHHV